MMRQIAVNIGCGQTPTRGWINYDNSPTILCARIPILHALLARIAPANSQTVKFARIATENGIKYANAAKRIPLRSGTVDIVYSSGMLVQLDRQDARVFLDEVMRVLRPGGILRLANSDIRKLAQNYIATGDADHFIASTLMCAPRPRSLVQFLRLILVGARRNNWMYDSASLSKLLVSHGFVDPVVLPAGQTTISEPGDLDLFERNEESIYVEARKPVGAFERKSPNAGAGESAR